MKEARAHGSAVQQGGLAACAHEKQPQLQDEQLGGSSAEDAARADKRQGAPSSAARAPRSLPDGSSELVSIGWPRKTLRAMLILLLSTAATVAAASRAGACRGGVRIIRRGTAVTVAGRAGACRAVLDEVI